MLYPKTLSVSSRSWGKWKSKKYTFCWAAGPFFNGKLFMLLLLLFKFTESFSFIWVAQETWKRVIGFGEFFSAIYVWHYEKSRANSFSYGLVSLELKYQNSDSFLLVFFKNWKVSSSKLFQESIIFEVFVGYFLQSIMKTIGSQTFSH